MDSRIKQCLQNKEILVRRHGHDTHLSSPYTKETPVLDINRLNELISGFTSNNCKTCGNKDEFRFDDFTVDRYGHDPLRIQECKVCSSLCGADDSVSYEDVMIDMSPVKRQNSRDPDIFSLGEVASALHACETCGNSDESLFYRIPIDEDSSDPMVVWQCMLCPDVVREDTESHAQHDHRSEQQDASHYMPPTNRELGYLNEIVSVLNCCSECGNHDRTRFKTIAIDKDRVGFDPLSMRHCLECSAINGMDDTMSREDAIAMFQAMPMDLCECGNTDSNLYIFQERHGMKYIECQVCFREIDLSGGQDPNDPYDPWEKSKSQPSVCYEEDVCDTVPLLDSDDDDDNTSLSYAEVSKSKIVGRVQISSARELRPGDHIAWKRAYFIWHHALVKQTHADGSITVINYTNDEQKQSKGKVKVESIPLTNWYSIVYKMKYDGPCFPAEIAIQRAMSRLNEKQYNLFSSNCEHFITWCKTNKKVSEQVKDAVKGTATQYNKTLLQALPETLFAANFDDVVINTAKAIPRVSGNFAKAAKIGGPLIVTGIELAIFGKSVYDAYQQKKAGHIDTHEFINITVGKASKGICRGGGAIAGAAIGQALIPIPIVGAVVGGTIGSVIGHGVGALFDWGFSKLRSLFR